MSLDDLAHFLTDPWMFTIPTLYVIAFFLVGLKLNFLGSDRAWMKGSTTAGFLYALTWGLVQGPQPFTRALTASGASFDYTWAGVGNGALILLGIVAMYYAFTKLVRHPKMAWLGLIIIGYHLGLAMHIALYRGKPLLELFG